MTVDLHQTEFIFASDTLIENHRMPDHLYSIKRTGGSKIKII